MLIRSPPIYELTQFPRELHASPACRPKSIMANVIQPGKPPALRPYPRPMRHTRTSSESPNETRARVAATWNREGHACTPIAVAGPLMPDAIWHSKPPALRPSGLTHKRHPMP